MKTIVEYIMYEYEVYMRYTNIFKSKKIIYDTL